MASVKHGGSFYRNDVVGYNGGSGRFYGYKLLKRVYVEEIDAHRWIAAYGSAAPEADFVIGSESSVALLTPSNIRSEYQYKWSKDSDYKKGDILSGTGDDGTRVVLLYLSDAEVQRLTPDGPYSGDQGYGGLAHYQVMLKDLVVLKTRGLGSKRFSEI